MTVDAVHNEEILIERLKQDDLQAFDSFYWKYQKAVYQNVMKLVHDEAVAEDIVQEVFISLWEKRQAIDSERSIGGWLFVSSYNRAVNVLKKKLRESLAIKELQQQLPADESDLSEIQYTVLEQAIATLSPQKRKVFELCKLQGLTYEQAAVELKISKHTVKEYLSSAIATIKEYAQEHGTGLAVLFFFKTICS